MSHKPKQALQGQSHREQLMIRHGINASLDSTQVMEQLFKLSQITYGHKWARSAIESGKLVCVHHHGNYFITS